MATTTITKTASANITLTAGQWLVVSGDGTYTLGPGLYNGKIVGIVNGAKIGPFADTQTVSLCASVTDLVYYTQSAPIGTYPMSLDPASGLITDPAQRVAVGDATRRSMLRRPTTVRSDCTIAVSATAPSSGRKLAPIYPNVRPTHALTHNSAMGIWSVVGGGMVGVDCIVTGGTFILGWRCQVSNSERLIVWVDGQPCMASHQAAGISTSAGNYYWVTVTLPDSGAHRVEVGVVGLNSLVAIYIAQAGSIMPAAKRRVIGVVGDSFMAGSAANASAATVAPSLLYMEYDVSVINGALGGTGYATAGSFTVFGSATRVSEMQQAGVDDLIFYGSVNDDGLSGIYDAAVAAFAAYRVAAPLANMVVFGPQPNSATSTVSANRKANNVAIAAAAAAAKLTFYDQIGNSDGSSPATWQSGVSYDPGAVVIHNGSIWRHDSSVAASYTWTPGSSNAPTWTLLTFDLFGTGNTGSVQNNGSRDVLLYSDGVHPTDIQEVNIKQRIAMSLLR